MHKSRAQHAEKFVSGDSRSLLTPCLAPPAVVWYHVNFRPPTSRYVYTASAIMIAPHLALIVCLWQYGNGQTACM